MAAFSLNLNVGDIENGQVIKSVIDPAAGRYITAPQPRQTINESGTFPDLDDTTHTMHRLVGSTYDGVVDGLYVKSGDGNVWMLVQEFFS